MDWEQLEIRVQKKGPNNERNLSKKYSDWEQWLGRLEGEKATVENALLHFRKYFWREKWLSKYSFALFGRGWVTEAVENRRRYKWVFITLVEFEIVKRGMDELEIELPDSGKENLLVSSARRAIEMAPKKKVIPDYLTVPPSVLRTYRAVGGAI